MLSERYTQRRYQEGLLEGEKKGREEERWKWEAWDQRRRAAMAAGEPFDEPPPSQR